MRTSRSTVTAATVLLVAAVTAASAAWSLAAPTHLEAAPLPGAAGVEGPREAPPRFAPDRKGRTGPPGSPATRPVRAPDRLSMPAIGVDADVVPTGVTRKGHAEIPPDGDVVGWYEYGSTPGARHGNAVLIGHRDTIAEGAGALFDLDAAAVGDGVSITSGRRTYDYQVVRVQSVEKARLPHWLFRRGGPPRLVVITCGGPFVADAGGYQENLYLVAAPHGRR